MDSLTLDHPGDPVVNESLSPRERELLVLAMNGLTDQGIAHKLGISVATVSTYWGRVRIKFGALPRPELVARFVQAEMARATESLAASEARLRTLLESSPLGTVLADPQGRILFANSAFERLAGRGAEELLGKRTIDLVHPEDQTRLAAEWSRCIEQGVPYNAEYRLVRPDGSTVWARSRGNVWRIDEKVGGRVGIVEDVTAVHEAERARAAAERRYRTLLSLAPEAILSVDEDLKIVEFNPGAERIFGYAQDEAVGQPLSMLIPVSSRDAHGGYMRNFGSGAATAARPMASRSEVRGVRKGGEEFACESSIIRETVDDKPLFTAILRDVSDRKDAKA